MAKTHHKLTPDQVQQIRQAGGGCGACGTPPSTRRLAARFGISHVLLWKIWNGQAHGKGGKAQASHQFTEEDLMKAARRLEELGIDWKGKDQLRLAATILRIGSI
jgi:hypothetical protein